MFIQNGGQVILQQLAVIDHDQIPILGLIISIAAAYVFYRTDSRQDSL